jgi:hypothetical protein
MNNDIFKVLYRGKIFIFLFIIIFFFIILNIFLKKTKTQQILKKNNLQNYNKKVDKIKKHFKFLQIILINEAKMPHLNKILKKRIFKIRLPLPKEIKCKSHLNDKELTAFLSLLTKDTIFFETGSGCSSIMAKYYAKKTYAVEGCKQYYEMGIKNGLKDILIFNDLKPDNPTWSFPGKKSILIFSKNFFSNFNHINMPDTFFDNSI